MYSQSTITREEKYPLHPSIPKPQYPNPNMTPNFSVSDSPITYLAGSPRFSSLVSLLSPILFNIWLGARFHSTGIFLFQVYEMQMSYQAPLFNFNAMILFVSFKPYLTRKHIVSTNNLLIRLLGYNSLCNHSANFSEFPNRVFSLS